MSERTKLLIACLIKNTIELIIFAILAILFNRWWIVFFSALFWSSVTSEKE